MGVTTAAIRAMASGFGATDTPRLGCTAREQRVLQRASFYDFLVQARDGPRGSR